LWHLLLANLGTRRAVSRRVAVAGISESRFGMNRGAATTRTSACDGAC
jgi:hypothetical protein